MIWVLELLGLIATSPKPTPVLESLCAAGFSRMVVKRNEELVDMSGVVSNPG